MTRYQQEAARRLAMLFARDGAQYINTRMENMRRTAMVSR